MKTTPIAIAILTCVGLAAVAQGMTPVSNTFSMPIHVASTVFTSGCENSPGPTVTLNGALSLGGMGVRLIFRNNAIGTHTATDDSMATATVIPEGQSIQIPSSLSKAEPGETRSYQSISSTATTRL